MNGMFPKNKVIEIFGEQLQWPGVGPDGKFTNGSFTDPSIKPSFIPAETINLILENLQNAILAAGLEPNHLEPDQLARALQALSAPHVDMGPALAGQIEGYSRDLMKLILGHGIEEMTSQSLRNEAIAEVMANIRHRCNNNGEIDGSGIPEFRGLMVGDYLDGIDLSGVAAAPGGTAPQVWNDTYKNNRIVVSGFNTYKYSGNAEETENHIMFSFRNILCKGRMRTTDTNVGGYAATDMRTWLDGTDGIGNGSLATKLKQQLGGEYLQTTRQMLSTKGSSRWISVTLWLPSESNVFGEPGYGEVDVGDRLHMHIPIYQMSTVYRVKFLNGARHWYWVSNPSASTTTHFCYISYYGLAQNSSASNVEGGVSPVFCVL